MPPTFTRQYVLARKDRDTLIEQSTTLIKQSITLIEQSLYISTVCSCFSNTVKSV